MEENKVEKKRINKNLLKYVAIILILLLILINIPGPQKSANEKKLLVVRIPSAEFYTLSVALFDDGTIYQADCDLSSTAKAEIVKCDKQTKRISSFKVFLIKSLVNNVIKKEQSIDRTALTFNTNIKHLNSFTINNNIDFKFDNLFSIDNSKEITVEKMMSISDAKRYAYGETYIYDSNGKKYYLDKSTTSSISSNILDIIIDKYLTYDWGTYEE